MSHEPSKSWQKLIPHLSEAQRRWYVAQKAIELGHGGIEKAHHLTGISRPTIRTGIKELQSKKKFPPENRSRKSGGGRKSIEEYDTELHVNLLKIMDETTKGDPMSALKWTSKACRTIAEELRGMGHVVSYRTVYRILSEENYSLQANKRNIEGEPDADRDEQFKYINKQVKSFMADGMPVISVDAKKKEKIGSFKNDGKTWRPKGKPIDVNVYDFDDLASGRATPYGAYDLGRNEGFVNVGISHDTGEFAVESIRRWWRSMGEKVYRGAKRLLVCADGGGSNGSRNKLWKAELQKLADETGIAITVCHLPPGTSKWNGNLAMQPTVRRAYG